MPGPLKSRLSCQVRLGPIARSRRIAGFPTVTLAPGSSFAPRGAPRGAPRRAGAVPAAPEPLALSPRAYRLRSIFTRERSAILSNNRSMGLSEPDYELIVGIGGEPMASRGEIIFDFTVTRGGLSGIEPYGRRRIAHGPCRNRGAGCDHAGDCRRVRDAPLPRGVAPARPGRRGVRDAGLRSPERHRRVSDQDRCDRAQAPSASPVPPRSSSRPVNRRLMWFSDRAARKPYRGEGTTSPVEECCILATLSLSVRIDLRPIICIVRMQHRGERNGGQLFLFI